MIFNRFRSLRLRKKHDLLQTAGAAKSLEVRQECPTISIEESIPTVTRSAPPTAGGNGSSSSGGGGKHNSNTFLLKRMEAEEESVGLSMEEVVRLSRNASKEEAAEQNQTKVEITLDKAVQNFKKT